MFGVLAIDKPAGLSSRDVVNRVQRLCRPAKVGHTGTLDPMATGVLLLPVGSATRLVEFSHEMPKSYDAEFQLGFRSDTLDTEGDVRPLSQAPMPSLEQIVKESEKWIGSVQQVPPNFSAINVGGKRAYALARQGAEFELSPRTVEIQSIRITGYQYPQFRLQVTCGSGTYIRSLGSDLARGVGSDAVMSRLVRTSIGRIGLAECVSLDDLVDAESVLANLHPAQCLTSEMPSVVLRSAGCDKLRNGITISDREFQRPPEFQAERLAAVDENEQLVAILRPIADHSYRSLRVFQNVSDTSQPKSSKIPQIPES